MAFQRLQPGRPYGVEVLQDPDVYFSSDSFSHPLRPLWRWWFTHNMKKQCRQAGCCLYVTERILQQRYPPGRRGNKSSRGGALPVFSVGVSDVEMQDAAFIDGGAGSFDSGTASDIDPKEHRSGRFRIIYVGTLEHSVKAPDILVTSFAQAVRAGLDAELAMVGDGRERPRIEGLAQSLLLGDRVKFLGYLSAGEAVRRQLDTSDLFILPSRSEGMPRAMIEAMARGLPCIGSWVGGIPELLPEAALVRPGDVASLTAKILQLARDPSLRAEMGRQNLATAHRYHESILQPKRIAFYEKLRESTQAWQKYKE
jgi:glycosyltransferase involved in cell wall biosynthesis